MVCNRVIPDAVTDSYFETWKATQAKYIGMIEEGFAPIPVRYVPLMDSEVVGLESLGRIGDELFGEDDPTTIYHQGRGHTFEKLVDGYQLLIPLPFATKAEINLQQVGDELVVQVGSQKRNVVLPRALVGMQTQGAKLEHGVLKIRFAPAEKEVRSSA